MGGAAYLGKDVLGSVRGVSNEWGQLEERYEYDAFGKPYKGDLDSGMNLGYTGKPYDTATGMYNYGYRDYKPEVAQFTTVDPIRDGRNWFVYVNNDPVNYVDLWGLECEGSDKKNAQKNTIGKIQGYPESGSNKWRMANDQAFIDATNAYNTKYGLGEGDDAYVTPQMLKAQAMAESGDSPNAFATDPLQVNNPGDWDKRKEDVAGLSKNQEMTSATSAAAALEWRHYKGYIHDDSGAETTWRGDWEADKRYNGNTNPPPEGSTRATHAEWYADKIEELSK
jgi:RHS repeat-associated protein